jgi:outer membrane immunogenic protein
MFSAAVSKIRNSSFRSPLQRGLSRVVGIAAVVLGATGSVSAADMPVKAPPAAAPVYNWTGCYGGANGGGASAGSDFATTLHSGTYLSNPVDLAAVGYVGSGSANSSGVIGGVQAGCNLQSGNSGNFVYGLEADWAYFDAKATFTPAGTLTTANAFTITNSLKTDWLATVRPRLGIAAGSSVIYITGGGAFAEARYSQAYLDTAPAIGSAAASRTVTGWTVGAGFETTWTEHWTGKVEYLFAKFSSVSAVGAILASGGGVNVLNGSAELAVQTVRVGINYKL